MDAPPVGRANSVSDMAAELAEVVVQLMADRAPADELTADDRHEERRGYAAGSEILPAAGSAEPLDVGRPRCGRIPVEQELEALALELGVGRARRRLVVVAQRS